jgi:hypothetical protein
MNKQDIYKVEVIQIFSEDSIQSRQKSSYNPIKMLQNKPVDLAF